MLICLPNTGPFSHLSIYNLVSILTSLFAHLFICSFDCVPIYPFHYVCSSICPYAHLSVDPSIYWFICLSFHLLICLSNYQCICTSVYLHFSLFSHISVCPICPYALLSLCPSFHFIIRLSVHLSVCSPVCRPICPFAHLSVCPPGLPVYLPICLHICTFANLSAYTSVHLLTSLPTHHLFTHLSLCPCVCSVCLIAHQSICPNVSLPIIPFVLSIP
jgi:hypothetical protein